MKLWINPFKHYEANHKQTSVFIKRFFGRWSYPDIAKAHDISTDAARKLYYAGVQKLLAVIIEMDYIINDRGRTEESECCQAETIP